MPKDLALEIINEFERATTLARIQKVVAEKADEENLLEYQWLKDLLVLHPALKTLPSYILNRLAVRPGSWTNLPVNRHKRKRLKQGYVAHLYAGAAEGYTFQKAMMERGLSKKVLELDIKRGEGHDLLNDDLYGALLRTTLDGALRGIIGGPNCRSRSVLRHYPGGPRPLRRWGGEEYGLEDLSAKERQIVRDDDLLLWRLVFLGIVGDYVAKAKDPDSSCGACPDYNPDVVSFWKTEEWKTLQRTMGWKEQTFNQGDLVETATETAIKPTTWGGNLVLDLPTWSNPLAKGRDHNAPGDSQLLARWVPGLMKRVASAVGERMFGQGGDFQLKALSWSQHVQAGHIPFRRDCRVCQEASAKSHPHRRVAHPHAGTLSIDVAGPYIKANEGAHVKKYMLVGAFTWLKPNGGRDDPLVEAPAEDEDLPVLEEGGGDRDRGEPEHEVVDAAVHGEEGGARPDEAAQPEEQVEERIEPKLNVFRLCIPLESKKPSVVLQGLNTLYIQLRIHGYPVTRLHSDRGREFEGGGLQQWCNARSIYRTTTAGASPQSNGRAERAVQEVKLRIQRALRQAGMGPDKWPLACRYVHELERRRWADREDRPIPPFGETVLVKRRYWGRKTLEPTHEKVIYIARDPEAHGHRVLRENGALAVAPYFIAKTQDPVTDDKWIALLAEQDREAQAYDVRRRIRGKVAMRSFQVLAIESMNSEEINEWFEDEEKERIHHDRRVEALMEQEAVLMLSDEQESMHATYEELRRLKQAKPTLQAEDDVIRTRIVSVNELLSEKELWHDAISGEMNQLFTEKEALIRLTDEEFESLKVKHGAALEIIPIKAVLTKKPGPRRRFRMVACGNYIEKDSKEELYASGADALTVRYALKKAAELGWRGMILDVKVAFLHAPLKDDEDSDDDSAVVLKPPSLLVKLGYAKPGEHYQAVKAVYGLRQAPRKWGRHRDKKLLQMKTPEGYVFRPSASEPNLWRILKVPEGTNALEIEEFESELYGFMVVYVDDIMVLSREEIVIAVQKELQREWDTSTPEWLGKVPAKFLGMEISEHEKGFLTSQAAYIQDKTSSMDVKDSKVPTVKDMYPPPEDQVDEKDVRLAQKDIGELLWISTRTRPELAFVVSRCSAMVLSAPKWVLGMSKLVWGYLKSTQEHGLWFTRDHGADDAGVVVWRWRASGLF